MNHTQRWEPICPDLRRVQERARANREEVFTSLAHHLTVDNLKRAYQGLKAKAAAGADGETKASYGKGLKGRLEHLHESLKTGRYRATAAIRIYQEKPDGSQRPINLQAVEDKIVQGAVVEILQSFMRRISAPSAMDFGRVKVNIRPCRRCRPCCRRGR